MRITLGHNQLWEPAQIVASRYGLKYGKRLWHRLPQSLRRKVRGRLLISDAAHEFITATRRASPERHLYVVQASNGLIKIGITGSLQKRVAIMRTQDANGPDLVLLASCPGTRSLEKRLHQRYHNKRTHGEWFALSDSDLEELLWSLKWDIKAEKSV